MDSQGDISILVTVVESGSFSKAAERLGISKSAISKRVSQLEAQLGVKLLHRTTRKLSLTEAGEHFFKHAQIAHQASKDAIDAVAQLQGEPQGRLKISCPMSFGRLHLAPLIPKFLKKYPKITIDLVMDDKISDIIGQGFDLAIRGGVLPDSNLVVRKLAPLRSVLCASQTYLNQHGVPAELEALSSHNCLAFTYSNDKREWTFMKEGEVQRISISGNYQVNSSEALKEAIIQGLGIGRLPTFIAGPEIKKGNLVALFEEYEMPRQSMYAVYPERHYLPKKVRVFIDFIVEQIGTDIPYWDVY
ncbi:LysR family transcriptional regulator [Marinomonas mediterranea]|uniref:LysR family transcriptional regulator n=1 Tax=Marinomonas mediterranea TaxID=119864 RepID=UPI00234B08D9|nr:LysR family transcriptional regulator [Marinomonas mediterranea]WCN10961.1 LysR family transcriptional regulator [Marinomonas mediterranea]